MMKKNVNILSASPPSPPPPSFVCFLVFPRLCLLLSYEPQTKKSISKLPSKFCCEKGMLMNCQYIIILGYQQHEY